MEKKQLYDIATGALFFPKTHTEAVEDDQGHTAEERLKSLEDKVEVIDEINSVARNVIDSTAGFYFADNDGNVAVEISDEGVFDCAAIGDNLKAIINVNSDSLPSYLQSEFNATIEALTEHPIPVIAFATDLHIRPADSPLSTYNLRDGVKRMLTAMRMVSKQFPTRLALLNGDYIQPLASGNTNKMDGIECIMDIHKWFAGVDATRMMLNGNHEAQYSPESGSAGLDADERLGYVTSKYTGNQVKRVQRYVMAYGETWATATDLTKRRNDGKLVYYYLDDEQCICHVFVDSVAANGITNYSYMMQEVWAANTLDYPYVFWNHFSLTGYDASSASTSRKAWGDAKTIINYFHSNGKTDIIAWIGGHCHCEDWDVYTNGNYKVLFISCLQAGLLDDCPDHNGDAQEHAYGTAEESNMSLFQIDTANKKIYQTQFGLGHDYEYNYNGTPTRTLID